MSHTITVSDETFESIKDQLTETDIDFESMSELVGKKIFVRMVNYHLLGEVTKLVGNIIFLKNASWVADSKRFSDFIKNGVRENAEIEYVGNWFFNSQAMTDGCIWVHKLPNKTQ